jgi:hypothetical protein
MIMGNNLRFIAAGAASTSLEFVVASSPVVWWKRTGEFPRGMACRTKAIAALEGAFDRGNS